MATVKTDSSYAQMHVRRIAERLWEQRAAVMVGAGFSKNADPAYPNWSEFANAFWEKLHKTDSKEFVNILQVMEEVQANFNNDVVEGIVKKLCDLPGAKDLGLHKELLELPWADVFTTNYDLLLEDAAKLVSSRTYGRVYTSEDLVTASKPRIVKVHGSFPAFRPYIVTGKDYREYERKHSAFVNTVKQSLLENLFCLVGYSGDDPDFLQWVDWVLSIVGDQAVPWIYMLHVDQRMTKSKERLLQSRHILPICLYALPGAGETPKTAFKALFEELVKANPNATKWPSRKLRGVNPDIKNVKQFVEIVREWQINYPGWTITPYSQRESLIFDASPWMCYVPASAIDDAVKKDYIECMLWLYERTLVPLMPNIASFIDETLSSLSSEVQDDMVSAHVALAHYYREIGDYKSWNEHVGFFGKEHEAFYERILMALQRLDLSTAIKQLKEWVIQDSAPLWKLRKAGLLAELGDQVGACALVSEANEVIRGVCNTNGSKIDREVMSVESIARVLHKRLTRKDGKNNPVEEWYSRVFDHKRYQCDISELFEEQLSAIYQDEKNLSQVGGKISHEFDVGAYKESFKGVSVFFAQYRAYAFLRMVEISGLPYFVDQVVYQMYPDQSYSLTTLLPGRFDWIVFHRLRMNAKDLKEFFSRANLHRLSVDAVNDYASRVVEALKQSQILRNEIYGPYSSRLLGQMPEILSRLFSKCSIDIKKEALSWLEIHYDQATDARIYDIGMVWRRLWTSLSLDELVNLLPEILAIPCPRANLDWWRGWIDNPFSYRKSFDSQSRKLSASRVRARDWERIEFDLHSESSQKRNWALETACALLEVSALTPQQLKSFAKYFMCCVANDDAFVKNRFANQLIKLPNQGHCKAGTIWKHAILAWQIPTLDMEESQGLDALKNSEAIQNAFDVRGYLINVINARIEYKQIFNQNDVFALLKKVSKWWHPEYSKVTSDGTRSRIHKSILALLVRLVVDVFLPTISRCRNQDALITLKQFVCRLLRDGLSSRCLQAVGMVLAVDQTAAEAGFIDEMYDDLVSGHIEEPWDEMNALDVLIKHRINLARIECVLARLIKRCEGRSETVILTAVAHMIDDVNYQPSSELVQQIVDKLNSVLDKSSYAECTDEQEICLTMDVKIAAKRLARAYRRRFCKSEDKVPPVVESWLSLDHDSNEFAEVRIA